MKRLQKKTARQQLGSKIRELRKAQKLSQAQLAFESGLSRQEISYLESGLQNVTLDTMLSIASVLDAPIEELMDFGYCTSLQEEVQQLKEQNKLLKKRNELLKGKLKKGK